MDYTLRNTEIQKKNAAQQTALIIGLVSSLMIFGGFTSAFLVRKASAGWVNFEVPDIFWLSTILIGLSSLSLIIAFHFFNKQNVVMYRIFTLITLLLGVAFIYNQVLGWQVMQERGVSLTVASSGTFFYLISALHLLHVGMGLIFLIRMKIRSIWKVNQNNIKELATAHPTFKYNLRLFGIYWHSIGILWIYLFFFVMWYK